MDNGSGCVSEFAMMNSVFLAIEHLFIAANKISGISCANIQWVIITYVPDLQLYKQKLSSSDAVIQYSPVDGCKFCKKHAVSWMCTCVIKIQRYYAFLV